MCRFRKSASEARVFLYIYLWPLMQIVSGFRNRHNGFRNKRNGFHSRICKYFLQKQSHSWPVRCSMAFHSSSVRENTLLRDVEGTDRSSSGTIYKLVSTSTSSTSAFAGQSNLYEGSGQLH
jgi:hypothetical protein